DEVLLHLASALHTHDLLRVERADLKRLSDLDVLAVLDEERRALEYGVDVRLVSVVGSDDDLLPLLALLDRDAAGRLGDRGRTLGGTRLEELLHAGQTLRDVIGRCRTTGVERTHRQLRAGLTDRLGGDDTDRLADVDEVARCERTPVAASADADRRVTGEHGAHLDLGDAGGDELVDHRVADVLTRLG